MTSPIRAPITKPQWPAGLRLRIAVLNRPPCDPANEPDLDFGGSRPSQGVAEASSNPIQSLLLAACLPQLTRPNLPASFTAHRSHAAATAAGRLSPIRF